MLTIKGTYDGKEFKPLSEEDLPEVEGVVPVQITFLPGECEAGSSGVNEAEAAKRMRAERNEMTPLGFPVKDLVEDGRYR